MAALNDPAKRQKYLQGLSDWNLGNGFQWTRLARDFVTTELELTTRRFGELMYQFACSGGEIDYQIEKRPEWRQLHKDRYDLRMAVEGRRVYIETRLLEQSRVKDPEIFVVNVHDE